MEEKRTEEDPYLTPRKVRSELDGKKARSSPPMSPKPYCDADQGEEDDKENEDDSTNEIKRGTLYASTIISGGPEALKILAWVLGEMEQSPIIYIPLSICGAKGCPRGLRRTQTHARLLQKSNAVFH